MSLIEHIKSERFIHDSLVEAARRVVEATCTRWNKGHGVDACVIGWPGEVVLSDAGRTIDGPCLASLERVPVQERLEAVKQFARRTNAYALLLIEKRAQAEVTARFESPHGVLSWMIKLERHGDLWVAQRPREGEGSPIGVIRRR